MHKRTKNVVSKIIFFVYNLRDYFITPQKCIFKCRFCICVFILLHKKSKLVLSLNEFVKRDIPRSYNRIDSYQLTHWLKAKYLGYPWCIRYTSDTLPGYQTWASNLTGNQYSTITQTWQKLILWYMANRWSELNSRVRRVALKWMHFVQISQVLGEASLGYQSGPDLPKLARY